MNSCAYRLMGRLVVPAAFLMVLVAGPLLAAEPDGAAADPREVPAAGPDMEALLGSHGRFSSPTDDTLALEFLFSLTGQRQYDLLRGYDGKGYSRDDDKYSETSRPLRGQRSVQSVYESTEAILDYRSRHFNLFVDWALIGDRRYDPSEPYMRDRYFYIRDAHVEVDYQPFTLKMGRTTQQDVVDTPYSLFVNSNPIPALQMETSYKGDFFFYTSRWVGLNRSSDKTYFGSEPGVAPFGVYNNDNPQIVPGTGARYDQVYPDGVPWADRGANFKVYGLNLEQGWRFGLQEGAVYTNSFFNPEFFLSPMPMYFTQIIMDGGNKPWGEFANSKHVMGFFLDRTTPDGYFTAQILVDDINGSSIPGIDVDFQNRLAWSLGGYRQFDFGQVGLYYAGATKYAFSATSTPGDDVYDGLEVGNYSGADETPLYYSRRPYPFTYFPAVEYPVDGGRRMPIDYRQNYLGYAHGENNMAIKMDYTNTFFVDEPRETGFYASLEWVLNGAKSPANPWHEEYTYKDISDSTHFLRDDLEHQLLFRARVERPVTIFGTPFTVFADGELGFIFNAMRLEPPFDDDDPRRWIWGDENGDFKPPTGGHDEVKLIDRNRAEPWIYRPQMGTNEVIYYLTVGITYRWQMK
ncbi:hypothetical protein SAMN05920897_1246 [Alkalispirochaeta americana]|uniref:Capsule assembly protein Wzi n=1 Tax=Alkalispirochaeta americana TaxID=159291 RepID=A0A1N6XG83_9SPIO|nr:hypothetical protein [Alkalispirochaeta americana]SIR01303.1 hypothetical protein SAMN05920897_1246 [Alkalispirochaeta americana]